MEQSKASNEMLLVLNAIKTIRSRTLKTTLWSICQEINEIHPEINEIDIVQWICQAEKNNLIIRVHNKTGLPSYKSLDEKKPTKVDKSSDITRKIRKAVLGLGESNGSISTTIQDFFVKSNKLQITDGTDVSLIVKNGLNSAVAKKYLVCSGSRYKLGPISPKHVPEEKLEESTSGRSGVANPIVEVQLVNQKPTEKPQLQNSECQKRTKIILSTDKNAASSSPSSLVKHKPFCRQMLKKVQKTEFEEQWKELFDKISSETLTCDEIKKIDETFNMIKFRFGSQVNGEMSTKPTEVSEPNNNFTSGIEGKPQNDQTATVVPNELLPFEQVKLPPLKLKLNDIFKKHAKRMKKQREKKLKQLAREKSFEANFANFIRNGKSQLPCQEKSPLPCEPSQHIPSQRKETCVVRKSRCETESIVKPPEPQPLKEADENILEEEDMLVEVIAEIKDEPLEEMSEKCATPIRKHVSNMFYTLVNKEFTMTCLLCSFKSNENMTFFKHLELNHKNFGWEGACNACSKMITPAKTIFNEFHHLLTHLSKDFLVTATDKKHVGKTNSRQPMVQIPFDIISSTKKPSVVPLGTPETVKRLLPWLYSSKLPIRKLEKCCDEMLTFDCLIALFKCMETSCSYSTTEKEAFQLHTKIHLSLQINDDKSFLHCSYCYFKGSSGTNLGDHVEKVHGVLKFQCSYCFYRGHDLQVCTHQQIHHAGKKPSVIKCEVLKIRKLREETNSLNSEINSVVETSSNVLPRIICMVCKSQHVSFPLFAQHLSEHSKFKSSRCLKCNAIVTLKTIIDHLKSCYKYGNIECAFCRFGTDSRHVFKIHLTNFHPYNYPLYFDRLGTSDLSNSIRVFIKRLPFSIDDEWIVNNKRNREPRSARKRQKLDVDVKSEC